MLYRLLENENRPLPQAPTHYVSVDILNKDLSIKRVTIYFNPADSWGDDAPTFLDAERNVGKLIADNLKFVYEDANSIAHKAYVIEIDSQKVIYKSGTYYIPNRYNENQ